MSFICSAIGNSFPQQKSLKPSSHLLNQLSYPQGLVPVVLAPYLNKVTFGLSIDNSFSFELTPAAMITSLVDTLHEIGYSFSKSKEQCRSALVQFGVKNVTPAAVAKVLGFIARVLAGFVDPLTGQNPFIGNTSNWPDGGKENLNVKQDSGQSSTWNVEIFIQTVKELVPSLQGKDVVKELDYPGFYVSNKSGFENLVKGLFLIVDAFPIDFLYSPWKNKEGQISWISNVLKHPDVFCFANFAYTSVDVSFLKNPPDVMFRDAAIWMNLKLYDILLKLSSEGLDVHVSKILSKPMKNYPELVFLGILQVDHWNSFKESLIVSLLPTFLENYGTVSVLELAWFNKGDRDPRIKELMLTTLSNWCGNIFKFYPSRSSRVMSALGILKPVPEGNLDVDFVQTLLKS